MDILGLLLAVVLPIVDQHQNGRTHHGNRARFQPDLAGKNEADNNKTQNRERLLEQHGILDRLFGNHRHDAGFGFRRSMHVLAPDAVDDHRLHRHDHNDHRRQVIDKGIERQIGQRSDQDIGRITDQRGRAADIGGKHFGKQKRVGRHIERAGNGQRHRHHQQNRRHIVQQRRQYRCGDLQDQQNAPGTGFGLTRRPDRQILEQAGPA